MYDTIATDLEKGHPLLDGLGAVTPLLDSCTALNTARTLALCGSEEADERARRLGMGTILVTEATGQDEILEQMSWYDDPIPSDVSLVLFDLGGVVVKDIMMLGSIARRFGLDRTEFFTDYRHYEFPLMEGFISEEAYWKRTAAHFGIAVDDNPFKTEFRPRLNDEMVRLIEALRRSGMRVVCASNTIDSHWNTLKDMGVLDLFDATYASHILGVAKPKHRFHRLILDEEGVDVSRAYFVDDSEENVLAARRMGLSTLLYSNCPRVTASERLASAFSLWM